MRRRGFTIVELLVVMAILLILMSLLLPSFMRVREHARYVKWRAHAGALSRDASASIHFDFEDQQDLGLGDRLLNKASGGNPNLLGKGTGAEDGHGQLGVASSINSAPTFFRDRIDNVFKARFREKGGLRFEASLNERVPINKTYGYRDLPEMSAAAWVRGTAGNANTNQVIMSFDRSSSFRFALRDDHGQHKVGFDTCSEPAFPNNSVDNMQTKTDYVDSEWHLITATYNSAGTLDADGDGTPEVKRIYVDGVKLASSQLASNQGTTSETNPHNGLPLGQGKVELEPNWGDDGRRRTFGYLGVGSEAARFAGSTGPNAWLDAVIDQVVLLEREMDPKEIELMYTVGKPRDER